MIQGLSEAKPALLALHKALVDAERETYEREHGPLRSPHQFLQLLVNDEQFAWMRELSQIIVCMDEAEDAKEPPADEEVRGLLKAALQLLTASPDEAGFGPHYRESLQRYPDVVLAHAQALKSLRGQ